MAPTINILEVTTDHAIPVSVPAGQQATIFVQGGASVFYGDTPQVSSTLNNGTLALNQTQTFQAATVYLRSQARSEVRVQIDQLSTAIKSASRIQIFGHSLASGVDQTYQTMVAAALGVPSTDNYAIGGAVAAWDDASTAVNGSQTASGYATVMQKLKRYVTKAPYTSLSDIVILHFGFNDMFNIGQSVSNSSAPTAQALPIFLHGMRTMIAIARSSGRYYAGDKTTNLDASITLNTAANWTNRTWSGNVNGVPVKRSGVGAFCGSVGCISTTTNGAAGSLQIKVPGDYPGSAAAPLYVSFLANPGLTAGTITASGAATGTFDLVQTTNATSGTCDAVNVMFNVVTWRFTGLSIAASNGAPQTLTLTPSGLAGGTVGWGFCEWGIESTTPPQVLVLNPQHVFNPTLLVGTRVRNSDVAAWNTGLQNLVSQEFGQDGNTYFVTTDLGGSGNTLGAGGTAGNAAAATVVSSSGWSSAVTSTGLQVSSVVDPGASGTAMVDFEIFTWTGRTGASPTWTLTGVTRGAYNTVAAVHGSNPAFDVVNANAITNFYIDGTHPSVAGNGLYVQQLVNVIRSSPGYAGAFGGQGRGTATGVYQNSWSEQVIAPQGGGLGPTTTLLKWDQAVFETAGGSMHDSAAAPGVFTIIGTYDKIILPLDGLYQVDLFLPWNSGRAGAGNVGGGIVGGQILLNGGGPVGADVKYISEGTGVADIANAFFLTFQSITTPVFVARKGDVIQAGAWQGNAGAIGAATQGVSTTVTDNPLTAGATTINLAATAGMASGDILRIEDESITIGTVASGTQLTGCTRAVHGTGLPSGTGFSHASGVAAFTGRSVGAARMSILHLRNL